MRILGPESRQYDAAAVVNVDSPLRIEAFARLMQSLAPRLMGDAFPETWAMFRESMHIERVPARGQALLRARQEPGMS